jgi:MoaA/NifB/PqqE/SkfB family radical SAM enzyme
MTLSASKGGIYEGSQDPQGSEIEIVRLWQEIGAKRLSGEALYRKLIATAKPVQVEMGIGNTCGLACKHCFLGYESGSMISPLVPLAQLFETLNQMVNQLETRLICVTDRDALTPKRSVPLFEHLAHLRQTYPALKFGGVTNGLLIPDFVDDLTRIQLDYLDISIDGDRNDHDHIRGEGKYDLVMQNLRLALANRIADRIMVATTLTRLNDTSIIRLIHQLIEREGVQWFDVGPLMAVKLQKYQLGAHDIVYFLESLAASLKPVNAQQPVTIMMELCAYCSAFLPALIESGWLDPRQIRQDRYGHLYQKIPINDSITLILRPELIPEYWRHTLRITADGYVVGGCEPLTQKNYQQDAIGNIQTEPIGQLYTKSLEIGRPFYLAMQAYDRSECRNKACFQHCLGGDALLARSTLGQYTVKDPNCNWEEYAYQRSRPLSPSDPSLHLQPRPQRSVLKYRGRSRPQPPLLKATFLQPQLNDLGLRKH